MAGNGFYGTPEEVKHLLSASGAVREELMRQRFGNRWVTSQSEADLYELPSGLIVPRNVMLTADPLDQMRVYLTTEEILGAGQTLPMGDIIDNIKQVPLEVALPWCASWVAKLHNPITTQREVDAEFIKTHLSTWRYRAKVENLLRDPHRVLLATQNFIVIAKIALEHCEQRGAPPAEANVAPLVNAALALPSHLTRDVEELVDDDFVVDTDAGPMGPYLVANQMFNNTPHWQTAWAIYHRCLRELPRELAGHPRVVNFEEAYLDATGVPLDDFVALCGVLWARAVGGNPTLPLSYFDALKWDEGRIEAALDLVAATPEQLRDLLRDDASSLASIHR